MLRVHQIPLALDAAAHFDDNMLRSLIAKTLGVSQGRIGGVRLQKRSVDARDKSQVHFTLTADVSLAGGEGAERSVGGRFRPNQVAFLPDQEGGAPRDLFRMPMAPWQMPGPRPLVVGAGPAGLFCALALALRGAKPILLERGQSVERRVQDVAAFEVGGKNGVKRRAAGQGPGEPEAAQAGRREARTAVGWTCDARTLDPESNVLFGEGGAGAFSDGKLTCGLNHPHIRTVLETLCACGAPQEILTAGHPHIGTDELRKVLARMRQKLIQHGAEVLFGHRLTGLGVKEGRVVSATAEHQGQRMAFDASAVFLATGHSARDTYAWLHALGLPMQAKPFAIGARIEHLQESINQGQYGGVWAHPALPPAEYKLNVKTPDGRGVYTFCMCPGGQVIGAVHEPGTVNVNGMSLHARGGTNANAALLTGVTPADFGSDHPLAGVAFQRQIEEAAFRLTGGPALCQRSGDLMAGKASAAFGRVMPSYRPGVVLGDLAGCLPGFVTQNFRYALPKLGQRLRGFDDPHAIFTGPETRSSAPVRILRGANRESAILGLYPLGEGAGCAGGIVSAAVDGLCAGMEA